MVPTKVVHASPNSTFADKLKKNRQPNGHRNPAASVPASSPQSAFNQRAFTQSNSVNNHLRPASQQRADTPRSDFSPSPQASSFNKVKQTTTSNSPISAGNIPSQAPNINNIMAPTHKVDNTKANTEMNNAEMWAAVMAKLESMQSQQSEEMQSLKNEIKITNSGFSQEISQLRSELNELKGLRNELNELKSQVQNQASELKQATIAEIKTQVDSQVAKQLNPQLSQLDDKISKQITSEVSKVEEKLEENLDNRQNIFQDEFVDKTEGDLADIKRDALVEKCQNRILNLILLGLEEPQEEEDEKENVSKVLRERLSVTYLKIDVVYRLGKKGSAKRPRPIMIVFSRLASRKAVWYSKGKLNEGQETKLRLQEDLPPQLRWELSILLKILRKAKSLPQLYPEARIKDYKIIINGMAYGVEDEDILPEDLRLAAIATPQSEEAVAFFCRDSPFSNHFACDFDSGGLSFNCMEQFLACHKAKTSNNRALATKIMRSANPTEHKRALNSMKEAVPEEWSAKLEEILIRGLRAKFGQNEILKKILMATYPRKLGEASPDLIWGTGFALNDEKVLDVDSWNKDGNLLGRSLEKVREQFLQEQGSTSIQSTSGKTVAPESSE